MEPGAIGTAFGFSIQTIKKIVMNTQKEKTIFQYPSFLSEPEWVPIAKRIRCYFNNELIADSERTMLKRKFPMVYFFPKEDVKVPLVEKGKTDSHNDDWGTSISHHVTVNGKIAENAAWTYEKPGNAAPENIENYTAIKWDSMDRWLEEDEDVRVHPRDPYHRIDICNSSRHVRIDVDGHTVAETHSPVLLFETGLPIRFYIKKTDVDMNLLETTDLRTKCPYKGTASYFSVVSDGKKLENVVWTYPFPNEETQKIKDLVAFYTEKIEDVFVDGKRLPKA